MNDYMKQYYKIKGSIRQRCLICSRFYTLYNFKRHCRSKFHLRHIGPLREDVVKDKTSKCELCGGFYTKQNFTNHKRTKKHLKCEELVKKTIIIKKDNLLVTFF